MEELPKLLANDEVNAMRGLCFWRCTDMVEPCMDWPLSMCDPKTIDNEDIVPSGLMGFTKTGKTTNQLNLKFNENQ